ncbi:MAG: hypothetical protein AB7F66_17715 [Bacteriovoracia bacterium]
MHILKNKTRVLDLGELNKSELPLGDRNLTPMHWRNEGTSIVYFECIIHLYFPIHAFGLGDDQIQPTPTEWKVVECKPGAVKTLPHQYYRMNTRDGTPIHMRRLRGMEALDPL